MEYAGLVLVESEGRYYFEDPQLAKTYDAKGSDKVKYNAFVAKYGLRESHSNKWPYWGAVLPVEAQRMTRQKYTNHFDARGEFKVLDEINDHAKLFVSDGGYVYTTQPYDLEIEDYKKAEALAAKWGLHLRISYDEAWWYPGRTPLVTLSQSPLVPVEQLPPKQSQSSGAQLLPATRTLEQAIKDGYVVVRGSRYKVSNAYYGWCRMNRRMFAKIKPRQKWAEFEIDVETSGRRLSKDGCLAIKELWHPWIGSKIRDKAWGFYGPAILRVEHVNVADAIDCVNDTLKFLAKPEIWE